MIYLAIFSRSLFALKSNSFLVLQGVLICQLAGVFTQVTFSSLGLQFTR